jgi:hypothetical protein
MGAPVPVVAGTGGLEIRAPGRVPLRRTVVIAAGRRVREWVDTPPLAASVATEARAPHPGGPAAGSGPTLRKLAWVSAGGAALAVGAVAVGALLRAHHVSEWNDDGKCLQGGRPRNVSCQGELDSANDAGTLVNVGVVAGGVLAATAAGLWWLSPARPAEADRRVACGGGPALVGLSCRVRFQ